MKLQISNRIRARFHLARVNTSFASTQDDLCDLRAFAVKKLVK
jgi:hypothetical protein